jgi:chromosome segregation ATPase
MLTNEPDKTVNHDEETKGRSGIYAVLIAGLVIALAGDGYLIVRSNNLSEQVAKMQENTQKQIAKLGTATQSLLEQRLDVINTELQGVHETADSAVKQAKSEAQKQGVQFSRRLDEQQKQVSAELTQLKDATTTANSKLNEVSTDVSGVKTDVNGVRTDVTAVKAEVASAQSELAKHTSDLKQVMGDMGVMSGLIATNGKELSALRELGERNYFEFTLSKRDNSKKVGDVALTLKKSDPKRSRFTLDVLADDNRVEKKDKTVNEPVQVYVGGNRQPYEIVINQVKKDEIVGYLATPKVKIARR